VSALVSLQTRHASQIYRRSSVSIRVYQSQKEGCEEPSGADEGAEPSDAETGTSAEANSSAEWYLGISSDLRVSANACERRQRSDVTAFRLCLNHFLQFRNVQKRWQAKSRYGSSQRETKRSSKTIRRLWSQRRIPAERTIRGAGSSTCTLIVLKYTTGTSGRGARRKGLPRNRNSTSEFRAFQFLSFFFIVRLVVHLYFI
jgi:hypothetical protein